jgi:hypothetical protein
VFRSSDVGDQWRDLGLLVLASAAVFLAQVATRIRLIARAPRNLSLDNLPFRIRRFALDHRKFGYDVTIVHTAVFVEELTRAHAAAAPVERVTFHDPCYLGRYAQKVDEPRSLLKRFGADIAEPERNREINRRLSRNGDENLPPTVNR